MKCNMHTLVAQVAPLHHSSTLLVKYRVSPDNQQGWFLPNDDLHHLEHPDQAARRILKEQAGMDDVTLTLKLAEIESFMGNNQTWHLIFDYLAFTRTMNTLPGKAVAELRWFEIDKLPPAEEFAHHGWGRTVLVKHALPKAPPLSTSTPR
jgi:ADP-ribose pyrophosphatase YjhB (NUDIX family)